MQMDQWCDETLFINDPFTIGAYQNANLKKGDKNAELRLDYTSAMLPLIRIYPLEIKIINFW